MRHKKRNSAKEETSSEYSFTVFFEPAAEASQTTGESSDLL